MTSFRCVCVEAVGDDDETSAGCLLDRRDLRFDLCRRMDNGGKGLHGAAALWAITAHSSYHFRFASVFRLARVLDEKPRDWAERRLMGCQSPFDSGHWQFDGQHLDLRALGRKSQQGRWENREKTPCRQETDPHLRGHGDHCHARMIKPNGPKGYHCDPASHAFWRSAVPTFAHHFGKVDPAPRTDLRAPTTTHRVVIEHFDVRIGHLQRGQISVRSRNRRFARSAHGTACLSLRLQDEI